MKARSVLTVMLAAAAWLCACAADALEGDWQVHGGGACLRVCPAPVPGAPMAVLWLDGPDPSIAPMEQIGEAVPGAEPGLYDFRVKADPASGKKRARYMSFAVRLTDSADGLAFEAYNRGRRVSLWRWIPYLFRVTVSEPRRRPAGLDGARRVGAPPQFIVL